MVNKKLRFHKALSVLLCLILLSTFITIVPFNANAASNDVAGINSGKTYYIKNLANGKYLDVYNGVDRNGTDVWTYTFNASNAQKWRVVRNSDGTYSLFSKASSNNRALDVTGSNVDIWAYHSGPSCYKFTLIRKTSSLYGGLYYMMNGEKYVVTDSNSNNSVKVKSTSEPSTSGLWSFVPVDKGDADIWTFYYKDRETKKWFDTRGAASTFFEKCNSMGYSSHHLVNDFATTAYNELKTDSIWVFRGHGLAIKSGNNPAVPGAGICFFTRFGSSVYGSSSGDLIANSSITYGQLNVREAISSLTSNALADARCVLYIGCSTGVSYNGYNLVHETFNKGAHFVLGTTVTTYTPQTDKWTYKFFERANAGFSIYECIHNADYYQSIGTVYFEGDGYAKLK